MKKMAGDKKIASRVINLKSKRTLICESSHCPAFAISKPEADSLIRNQQALSDQTKLGKKLFRIVENFFHPTIIIKIQIKGPTHSWFVI